MKQRLKKRLAVFLVITMIASIFQSVFGGNDIVQASDNIDASEPAYGTEISLGEPTENVYTLQADALERGTKYKLVVTAESAPNVTISNNGEDGNPYDGLTQYVKTKTMSETEVSGTFSVVFETAPVAFSNVTLSIDGAYQSAKLYEESYVEISGVPEKNQLALNGTATLVANVHGLETTVVTWNSSNSDVATVIDGVLTAKQVGKTEITATVIEDGITYEDYFELYVVNETLNANQYGLICDMTSPADFTLQIPSEEEIRVLQLSDTQIMSMENIRGAGTENAILTGAGVQRWGTENALYENCNYYIDKTFAQLVANNTLPHLVVLIGDNTYGNFDDEGKMLDALTAKMDEKCNELGIYWTFVFGNHDKESDIGIENILRKYSNSERCLYAYKDVTGDSNMAIALKQDNTFKQMVYLFDTNHTGSGEFRGNRVDEYAWMPSGIHESQKDWFKSVADSEVIKDVPSTVWMHIAFEEYQTVFEGKYGAESQHVYATNENDLGERHGNISIWDDNTAAEGTDFYRLLQEYNVTGVFCGHNHTNNFSVMSEENIRLTFGMKTGTYDEYWQGMLGGTLATTTADGLDVTLVDVIDNRVEDFDVAGPYGQDETGRWTGMKTASMTVEWGKGVDVKLIPDEKDGGQAIQISFTGSGDKFFAIRVPDIKKGATYHMTYEVKQSAQTAIRPILNATGATAVNGTVNYNKIYEEQILSDTFVSTADRLSSDENSPYVAIWFWNEEVGDTIIIDNITFKEVVDDDWTGITIENGAAITTEKVEEGYGDAAYKLTFVDTTKAKYFLIRIPDIKRGHIYKVSYTLNQSSAGIANQMHLISGGVDQTAPAKNNFTEGKMEGVFLNRADGTAPDPHVQIWFWNCKNGDTVVLDDFAIEELIASSGDYNYDEQVDVRDIVRVKRHLSGDTSIAAAITAEQSGDDVLDSNDIEILKKYMVAEKDSSEFSTENDDGTFEGVSGNISLYSGNAVTGVYGFGWSNTVSFAPIEDADGTSVAVTSTGKDSYEMLTIKFAEKLQKGKKYSIHMNLKELDDSQLNKTYYYMLAENTHINDSGNPDYTKFIPSNKTFTGIQASELFATDGMTIEFVADRTLDSFCFVLFDNVAGQQFNFKIDNIKLVNHGYVKGTSFLNDDGTFEGETGIISLYSAKDVSSDFAWAKDLVFLPTVTENGTVLHVKTNTESSITNTWDMLAIKFAQPIKNGVTYEVTMKVTAQDDTQLNGGWYYAFTDSTGLRTDGHAFKNYTNCKATTLFGDTAVTFSFTASKDDDSFYMILFENSGNAQANYTIDNITLKEVVTE